MASSQPERQSTYDWGGRRPKSPRSRIVRCVAITALALAVAVGITVLLLWLIIKPAPLEYTAESASIRGFNLTSGGDGGNALNATFDLHLITDNRNKKMSVYYDSMDVEVWYGGYMLAVASWDGAPFWQPSRNATHIMVSPAAKGTELVSRVAKNLRHDRTSGSVELDIRANARIRFRVADLKSRHYTLRVVCSPVVSFSGKKPFERAYCDVDV